MPHGSALHARFDARRRPCWRGRKSALAETTCAKNVAASHVAPHVVRVRVPVTNTRKGTSRAASLSRAKRVQRSIAGRSRPLAARVVSILVGDGRKRLVACLPCAIPSRDACGRGVPDRDDSRRYTEPLSASWLKSTSGAVDTPAHLEPLHYASSSERSRAEFLSRCAPVRSMRKFACHRFGWRRWRRRWRKSGHDAADGGSGVRWSCS